MFPINSTNLDTARSVCGSGANEVMGSNCQFRVMGALYICFYSCFFIFLLEIQLQHPGLGFEMTDMSFSLPLTLFMLIGTTRTQFDYLIEDILAASPAIRFVEVGGWVSWLAWRCHLAARIA